jgi:H+/gluconate symporter-like permease
VIPSADVSIASIVLALLLLMYLTYRGLGVLWLAPLLASLAVILSDSPPALAHFTQVFMPALGGFVIAFFPLFLLGALFGKLMQVSGSADAVAQAMGGWLGRGRAILAVVLACGLLTYGGVSLFVVAFAAFPIAASLFQQAAIPKRLIPGAIALGAFTFTMTALPGTPSIQNAIPMPFFGTSLFAAPGLGVLAGAVMLGTGLLWLGLRTRWARQRDEGFDDDASAVTSAAPTASVGARAPISVWLALLPAVVVVGTNYGLSRFVVPLWDAPYLSLAQFGATHLAAVQGMWSLVLALLLGIALQMAMLLPAPNTLASALNEGARESVMPLLNTASLVGFGAVVAVLPGFALLSEFTTQLAGGNPLVSISVAVNLLAGITGSASGGMSIALQTMGSSWLSQAQASGMAPDLLHRVTVIATGGLDALPHNGAVVTLLGICGVTHRQAYLDILVVAVLGPLLALVVVVALGTTFGSF